MRNGRNITSLIETIKKPATITNYGNSENSADKLVDSNLNNKWTQQGHRQDLASNVTATYNVRRDNKSTAYDPNYPSQTKQETAHGIASIDYELEGF